MAGTPDDENKLIQTARGGDLEAFNDLVLRYQDSVYSVAYRIMGEGDSAADVSQEVFITAFRRLETFRSGNFRAWLLRIATNRCYDELRRRKRRPATGIDDLPGADFDDGPPLPDENTPSPEQAVQTNELQRAIQNCINALKDDQKLVLVMSDVEGFDYNAIAESMEINLGTVKSRLSRARASVRQCLQAVQELLPESYRFTE
jgi:RNA polymerase sigma-70 factor (ECF subfamily)